MDSVVHDAVSEICAQGTNGISLKDLWPRLQNHLSSAGLDLCDGVKKAIWSSLLNIPGLQFKSQASSFSSQDASIQSFEDAEKLVLNVVAAEHLRNCFVGLYDIKAGDAGVSAPQRRVLERLAVARTDGVTQSQIAKEFGMKGKNVFYVVRNLEVCGLIVRQPTIVKTKKSTAEEENGSNSTSTVNTNLLHLYRYAKHLSSQQRLEITRSDTLESLGSIGGGTSPGNGYTGGLKDDVHVKDYLPAMKAICDKLEEADGKVLVVSDIKQALGYRRTPGHRAWRNICHRLKEVHLVEEFRAEVNKKVVSCLRLLKKFEPKYVEPKHAGFTSVDTDQPVKFGKQGQNIDQLLELPIEHQIYDLIDAEGPKGITLTEVCKRLKLNNKRNYSRLLSMVSRFGMHLQAETHNRSLHYRVWTPGNFTDGSSNFLHGTPGNLHSHKKIDQTISLVESSTPKDEFRPSENLEANEDRQLLVCGRDSHGSNFGNIGMDCDEQHNLENMVSGPIIASSGTALPTSSSKRRSYPRHPCLISTTESAQREHRILERLQAEKFILTVELHKWLESLEKDKHTTMDKKTLARILSKLEQEGHCRCIEVSVPLVTNFGRNRTTKVVLHSSLQSLLPELLIQIQERLRSFDMLSRGQGLARLKNEKKVPVLTNIDRTVCHESSDSQAVRSEAMRANGFVSAKMVRAKLLHNFLWGYLSSSLDWDDALYSGRLGYDHKNPHSTCKLFTLAVAVKEMPLELFLQVVGSTQKFESLVSNCKLGLRLSDLPSSEYTSLMDIQATKRLSSLVDILCRLKLIRLITDRHLEDRDAVSLAIFTYAMELKPYIEEPLSKVSVSLGVSSLDLRPRIRHDFILSNRDAVDIYWKTLEYCYATADAKAAIHAFPGSSVHEVFLYRSWASVRVMTADQRAELVKRIVRDDPNKKISFSDCLNIARDLNLTMEQVLRISNDKRQSRLNRYQNDLNPLTNEFISASQKRKKSSKVRHAKHAECEEKSLLYTDTDDHEICSLSCDDDMQSKTAESFPIEEDREEDDNFISRCALSRLKPSRQPKFFWTEASDKKLVIQYARHRATLGARFHRTDWVSLPDLPASPAACRRRMQMLNKHPIVRKAVMRLCTLLGERYARHLAESQQEEQSVQQSSPVHLNKNMSDCNEEMLESDLKEEHWADFDNEHIKMALDEVLRCKRVVKLEVSRASSSKPQKEWSDKFLGARAHDNQEEHSQEELGLTQATTTGEETQNHDSKRQHRTSCHRLPGKFLKLLNEGISVSRRAYESLAVANAVELLKLVFLNTSSAPEVPNLLAETLRRYSQHDLFAAFNYLREKRFMVGGNGSQPFVLSQLFLHNVSSSPFPTNTGKRAAKFISWLKEREQDLMEDTIFLDEALQCGDIYHLFALVCSGELFISPSLPDEGIGEADENKNVKRKIDDDEMPDANNVKRLKSGEVVCRRAKGFPGIRVSVSRTKISQTDAMGHFPYENTHGTLSEMDTDDKISSLDLRMYSCSSPSDMSACTTSLEVTVDRSPWGTMTSYGNQLLSTSSFEEWTSSLNPELFKTTHSTIYRAGDQGLSLEQLSQILALNGKEIVECIVDVLQVFGFAVKVDGYDDVRIVDASFRYKYFLTTIEGHYQGLKPAPCLKLTRKSDQNCLALPEDRASETAGSLSDVHKITLLNLPEDVCHLSNQVQTCNEAVRDEDLLQVEGTVGVGVHEAENPEYNSHSFRSILPWINGDGTTNPIVYKGLVRRILGIVMQNPGILEDDVISRMDVLNPQSCRKLLELMKLDNHLIVRKMHQTICSGPPSILRSLCNSSSKMSGSIWREHLFANSLSTRSL